MKIILSIIILFFLISCSDNQKTNWCKEGIKEAQEEINKNGLVFIKYLTIGGGADRYDEELKALLKESNISFRYEPISCTEMEGEHEERKCFNQKIKSEIENKYGKGFMERMSKQADEIFANKIDYIFEDYDLDKKPFFINPNGEENSGSELIKYLNKYLKYPDEYALAKTVEERPFVELQFVVNKNGKPNEFQITNSVFPKEKEEYRNYFETEVLKIISKIPKWESGRIHGKKVDTRFTRRIPLDWII
jgi:hypothetical protein